MEHTDITGNIVANDSEAVFIEGPTFLVLGVKDFYEVAGCPSDVVTESWNAS